MQKIASPRYDRINNMCLVVIAGVCITVALIYTRHILVPFVVAVFLYAVVSPGVRWLRLKFRLPRWLAALCMAAVFFAIITLIVIFVIHSFKDLLKSTHLYEKQVETSLAMIENITKPWGLSIDKDDLMGSIKKVPLFEVASRATGTIAALLGKTLLVMVFGIFLIAGEGAGKSSHLWQELKGKIARYIIIKFATSFTTAVVVGIVLAAFGIEMAFMFAVLTFLLNFIPNIGSIVAVLLPLPVAFLNYGLGSSLFIILGLLTLTQFTIGNIIEPKIMGEGLDLHPAAVLIFLMFWGLVWGLPGMFLAVPITAVLKIFFSRLEATKPFAELLAGRIPSH